MVDDASSTDRWLEDELRVVLRDDVAGLLVDVSGAEVRRRIAAQERRRTTFRVAVAFAAVLALAVIVPLLAVVTSEPAASPTPSPVQPSPTPIQPSPTAGPTETPAPAGWRWQLLTGPDGHAQVLVGVDGTVIATGKDTGCGMQVHAFDAGGRERAGWPYCAGEHAYLDVLVADGAGTVYLGANGTLVGVDPAGSVAPGWPREGWNGVAFGAGVVVVRASRTPDTLLAYGPSGVDLAGWPVTIAGQIIDPILPGADGTIAVLYRDASSGHRFVTLLGPDGRARPGWPVRVPAKMDGKSLLLETRTADGRVVLGAHEPFPSDWPVPAKEAAALPSQVAVITPDGVIPPGWPVAFDRPLSAVTEGPDGVLYAVAGDVQYSFRGDAWAGGPYDVLALRPDGTAPAGWPVRLPDGMTPQPADRSAGPAPWAQPAVVGDDGRVVVVTGMHDARDGLVWIGPNGAIEGTYKLAAGNRIGAGQPAAPGGPSLAPVLVGNRVFLAVSRGSSMATGNDALLAVEPAGIVDGWPLALPSGGWITDLLVAPDGTLVVSATTGETGVVLAADPARIGGAD